MVAQEVHQPDFHLPVNMALPQRAALDTPHIQNDVPTQNAMHERGDKQTQPQRLPMCHWS
jgi:hypothetical protein